MKPNHPPVMPLKNRLAVFTVERGAVEVEGAALVVTDARGVRAQLPVGAATVLMLEPGTTVTHAAVKLCAENRTLILWCGEGGVRLYSAGQEGAAHAYHLLRQAQLALDPKSRLAVARAMYRMRFYDEPPRRRSIEQLRGMEGARVRQIYRDLSARYGVPWTGRHYDRQDWAAQDEINRVLSAANSCLYGVCHAAILIAGYSAAIGFVHTGYSLAFVHDLADLYKMEVCAPAAFELVAENAPNAAMHVRHRLRDRFRRTRLLERLVPGIEALLDAGLEARPLPDELGGARREALRPEDAPWQKGPLPDPRGLAGEIVAGEMAPPRPPRPLPRYDPRADDGLPF